MKESLLLRFLYRTVPGRGILKLLVQPKVSESAGKILSAKGSRYLVPYYIRKHGIDMTGIDVPPGGFPSFNAFFTRKRTGESFDLTPGCAISPCDGLLTFREIKKDTVFTIKNTCYSLGEFLKDYTLAEKFQGGTAFIFRLTPADYHRYCYAANGHVIRSRKIQGKLHCVRPIALETTPVFIRNSREYQVLRTAWFGTVIQAEVGALLVGKIKNRPLLPEDRYVLKGMEKGWFEFGGSTIVLLFQKDNVRVNEALYRRQNSGGEIPVRRGEMIAGRKCRCAEEK